MKRPSLNGLTILVTRPAGQAETMASELRSLGATVRFQPTIRILPPDDLVPLDDAIRRLRLPCGDAGAFDWLLVASVNGVAAFDDTWKRIGDEDAEHSETAGAATKFRIGAIGAATAAELRRRGYTVDRVPEAAESEAFAAAFEPEARCGERFILIRASRGREILPERLTAWGASVRSVVGYRSVDVTTPAPGIPADLHGIDWVTATSSSIAAGIVRLFGESLRRTHIASISPITSAVLRGHGYEPAVEATDYTILGLIAAIRTVCRR